MVTKIDIGNFLERIEIIMAALWFMTIYIKLTISFYASSLCLAQVFNLKEYRFLLFPLGMIMIVLSIVAYPNSAYFQTVIGSIWFPYAFIYGGILPVFLLVISKIRKIFGEI
jgi:spore germination protein KB